MEDHARVSNLQLPQIPPVRPNYSNEIAAANKTIVTEGPWREKYVDAIAAMNALQKQKFGFRNQLILLLLNEVLELAYSDYLESEIKIRTTDDSVDPCSPNHISIALVKEHIKLPSKIWADIADLQKSSLNLKGNTSLKISDKEIESFRSSVQYLFWKLFKIRFPERESK